MRFDLKRPIPYTYSWRDTFIIGLSLAMVFCFILIFLKPFDTYSVQMKFKNLKLVGYALPTLLAVLSMHGIENVWYLRTKKWRWANEIVMLLLGFFTVAILSFIYLNNFVNQNALPWSEFLTWVKYYGLPFTPILMAFWGYLRFRFGKIDFNRQEIQQNAELLVQGEGQKDVHRFYWKEFLLARAQSNYVEVWTRSDNSAQKELLRIPLSQLAEQLPRALQVHRSYLINPDHFESLGGNSRKGWCRLQGFEEDIPVSPKQFKALKELFQTRP